MTPPQIRQFRRNHGPLTLIEVPPFEVQRDDEADRVVAGQIPQFADFQVSEMADLPKLNRPDQADAGSKLQLKL